jgi:hypothetical protein
LRPATERACPCEPALRALPNLQEEQLFADLIRARAARLSALVQLKRKPPQLRTADRALRERSGAAAAAERRRRQ